MKVTITIDVDDESADENDDTGVTNEAFEHIMDAFMGIGENIDIRKGS